MTPDATRTLRRALLGLLVVVTAAVAWSLRRPPPPPPAAGPTGTQSSGASFGGLVYRSFQEGKENYVVRARASAGQDQEGMHLQGVEVTFPRMVDGKPADSTVSSEECLYDPVRQKAFFHGHVRVVTGEGLELETESLSYRGDQGRAESKEAVRFKRNTLSGSSTGLVYQAGEGRIELLADAVLHIENGGDRPPTEIRSAYASAMRDQSAVRFDGDVQVTQDADSLRADHLTLDLTSDREAIDHALALDNVEARTGAASALPGVPSTAGRGPRILRCRRLAIWFRENRQPQEATAVRNAELEAFPGPGEPPEHRRLQAHAITFRFDEEGRLQQVEAGVGVLLSAEPIPPAQALPRTVRCESLTAIIDPLLGDLRTADFAGSVEFTQGKRRATSQTARYDQALSTLNLSLQPRLVDEEQGSDLRADGIDLGTQNGNLAARENVRHLFAGKHGPLRSGALARDTPTVIIADKLDYDGASHTARYQDNALLRSGQDETRAPLIILEEPVGAPRRLRARGGVVSVLNPHSSSTPGKPPAPVEVRGREMVYEEAKQRIVYTGEVAIRQGDIRSKSPEATVFLSPDGSAVKTVVAGEPVEVVQGERKGVGARGTYTPDTETFNLVGEKVTVNDPTQQVEGRSLTFHVGDDRILVDGREEVRTESIFKRAPPKK
ncbi:MAG TPA: LPS export ABC transporter periplasmic protein LptC [Vicinamibacteria bacterium]|nr:LPS export ABC transporter periplasmic protein LptC [Vicinamibacteria bacterium]